MMKYDQKTKLLLIKRAMNPLRIYKRNLPVPSVNRFLNEEEVETERSRLRTEFPEQMGWIEGLTINF